MATATQLPRRRDMQEVKAPELFQFTKQGQTLAGVLIRIEPTVVKGKDAVEYLLESKGRQRFTFLETADLKKKITPLMIGHWLEIRYETDQRYDGQSAGQSAMKIFKVNVSREKEPGYETL